MHAFRRLSTVGRRKSSFGLPMSTGRIASASTRVSNLRRVEARGIHSVKPLPYPIEGGLGEFLSPAALKIIAQEYQEGLLQRLNEEVAGTELADQSVAQVVIGASNDTEKILAWNYASQALNNSFFFDNLLPLEQSPPPLSTNTTTPLSHEHTISTQLLSTINQSFGSVEQLKSTLSAAALGMMGSGWIWLVCDSSAQHLGYVATYGPGTMLVRSRQHKNPEGVQGSPMPAKYGIAPRPTGNSDLLKVMGESLASSGSLSIGQNAPKRRFFASRALDEAEEEELLEPEAEKETEEALPTQDSADRLLGPNIGLPRGGSSIIQSIANDRAYESWDKNRFRALGDDLSPLLCISVHEHMWLSGGYGIWGKEEYLRRYWSVVNWAKVSRLLELWTPATRRSSSLLGL